MGTLPAIDYLPSGQVVLQMHEGTQPLDAL